MTDFQAAKESKAFKSCLGLPTTLPLRAVRCVGGSVALGATRAGENPLLLGPGLVARLRRPDTVCETGPSTGGLVCDIN